MKRNSFLKYHAGEKRFTTQELLNKIGSNPICYLTGQPIDLLQESTYSFDHIIPKSKGGTSDLNNVGLCSNLVNRSKTDMTLDEYLQLCKQVLLHHGFQIIEPTKSN